MDKAGQTCRSCLTLNPVGAPACVRCNSPLTEEQQPPSPWASPPNPPNSGLVQQLLPAPPYPPQGPQSQPSMSQPPVSPPFAYPPQSGPQPPITQQPITQQPISRQSELPAPPAARRRRVLIIGNAVVLTGLLIGAAVLWLTRPHYLDTPAVARTVGDRISANLHCPEKIHRTQGRQFTCSGTYDRGGDVTVRVTIRNDAGDYRWTVLQPPAPR